MASLIELAFNIPAHHLDTETQHKCLELRHMFARCTIIMSGAELWRTIIWALTLSTNRSMPVFGIECLGSFSEMSITFLVEADDSNKGICLCTAKHSPILESVPYVVVSVMKMHVLRTWSGKSKKYSSGRTFVWNGSVASGSWSTLLIGKWYCALKQKKVKGRKLFAIQCLESLKRLQGNV